ncbi:MAG TPA: YbhB/YbcL family Raf kinase inhibitor-like protein [Vicinamibacterales bacterium]|nr:YbhB/YbcL family Raf kinase inhibitor-like protein [Vicinamibacterales bacterium]
MTRQVWTFGFIGALALSAGLGGAPLATCVRLDALGLAAPATDIGTAQAPQQQGQQQQGAQQQGQRAGGAPQGGGRGGGRGAVAVMTLSTTGWTDGGTIPLKYSQAGDEVSPPLAWTGAPTPATSFVLIVHDIDAMRGNDDTLHWLVWNIPGTTTSLPEKIPQGPELADGSRQISATGPNYRGPGAPASGPAHHYLFELYALDTMIDVPAVGASPADTRAAIVAAMAGHVRGKASMVGLFRRTP